MTNKYPGTCVDCGQRVAARQGQVKRSGKRWIVSHGGTCQGRELTFKERFGHCEDAPCCGCCGNGQEYMSAADYNDLVGGW